MNCALGAEKELRKTLEGEKMHSDAKSPPSFEVVDMVLKPAGNAIDLAVLIPGTDQYRRAEEALRAVRRGEGGDPGAVAAIRARMSALLEVSRLAEEAYPELRRRREQIYARLPTVDLVRKYGPAGAQLIMDGRLQDTSIPKDRLEVTQRIYDELKRYYPDALRLTFEQLYRDIWMEGVPSHEERPNAANERPTDITVAEKHSGTDTLVEPDQKRAGGAAVFRKEGDTWMLSFEGKTVHLRHLLGMSYIAELLRHPHAVMEAATLAAAQHEGSQLAEPGIPLADPEDIRRVSAILKEKKAELNRLSEKDWVRRGPLTEEIEQISKYRCELQDNRGQPRKVGGTAQHSRTAVTNAIVRAQKHISKSHAALGEHLKKSIRTGTSAMYQPMTVPDWQF